MHYFYSNMCTLLIQMKHTEASLKLRLKLFSKYFPIKCNYNLFPQLSLFYLDVLLASFTLKVHLKWQPFVWFVWFVLPSLWFDLTPIKEFWTRRHRVDIDHRLPVLILRLHQQVLGVAHSQDSQQQREGDIGSHRNGTLSDTDCSSLACMHVLFS